MSLIPSRPVRGVADVAVTTHELATQAALEVMALGGNAVDGAIAANAVLGVVLPTTCGVGGDLFALVHNPTEDAPACLNASGRAGSGADASELRAAGHSRVPVREHWGVTVPGCVDGWEALVSRYGTMPLGDLLRPAIRASAGFPASDELASALDRIQPIIGQQPSAPPLYPDGSAPDPGRVLVRPDVGATLREIAAGGRGAFYGGAVGGEITAATGGRITTEDLATMQADWVDPISVDVFGRTGWTVPPNSQGYLTLAAAWLAEAMDPPTNVDSPDYHHALIEAYRAVAWERDDIVSDLAFAPLKPAEFLMPQRLQPRLAAMSVDGVASWPNPTEGLGGTAYLCVADRDGMGVSLIQSNFTGIGSGLSAGSTGVFLHNRGAGFNLIDGHPNELAPGKRPMHTLSPSLWTEDGDLDLLLGTRGGHQQPQLLLQVASHLYRAGLAPHEAQAAPRWTMDEFGPGSGSRVLVEPRLDERIVSSLRSKGHEVDVTGDAWQVGWGPISLIAFDDQGVRTGAADPRVSSASATVS